MKTKDQNVETLILETACNLSVSRTLTYKKQNILIRNHVNISLFYLICCFSKHVLLLTVCLRLQIRNLVITKFLITTYTLLTIILTYKKSVVAVNFE